MLALVVNVDAKGKHYEFECYFEKLLCLPTFASTAISNLVLYEAKLYKCQ